jgi:hypothetical protein
MRPILLKGAHLAFAVYPDPALRPMNDLDLLVAPEEVERASAVLHGLGYRVTFEIGPDTDYSRLHHERPVIRPGSVQVEIHHRLDRPPTPFQVDHTGLRSRARRDERLPPGVLVLDPQDLVLHLCSHMAFNHAFDVRLLAFHDIRQVAQRCGPDWSAIRARAEADGRAPFVQVALAATERLWPGSLPDGLFTAWPLGAREAAVVAPAVEYVLRLPAEVPVALRRMHETTGMRARLAALRDNFFPAPSAMRRIYHLSDHRSVIWSYLWRPFDLVRRRGRTLLRLAVPGASARDALTRDRRRATIEAWRTRVVGDAASS